MEQQIRELPADATLADVMDECDNLIAQGYLVHIEYYQATREVIVYGEEASKHLKALKAQYATLAAHSPRPGTQKWDDYQALMQGLERQLREAGVEL